MKKALIVVDYQYDFAHPQGSLYVPEGETIKDLIEQKIIEYKKSGNFVVFSGDFHPKQHISFQKWPEHCVVNTIGSNFCVDDSQADLIIKKGVQKEYDSYSAFYIAKDPNIESQLDNFLKTNRVELLEICGLALDVCVKATYEDAKTKGYNSIVNLKLSKALDKKFVLKI